MTRLFLRVALHRLAPSAHPAATAAHPMLVAPIPGTDRYEIRAGHEHYLAALASGVEDMLVEVTLPEPP